MNLKKVQDSNRVADMARVNAGETKIFPAGKYYVFVREQREDPHFHIRSTDGFEVKMNFDGDVIAIVAPGKRANKIEAFIDIAKAAKKWLKQKPARKTAAAKFGTNKEVIEFQWDENNS